jgi:hypothetical protein
MQQQNPAEGIIKFSCDWIEAELVPDGLADRLIAVRDELWRRGLVGADAQGIGFGNVSAALGTEELRAMTLSSAVKNVSPMRAVPRCFLITGSQTGRIAHLSLSDLALVFGWDLDANCLCCIGKIKASSESLTHAALYEADSRIEAVIHVHAPWYWARWPDTEPRTADDVPYGTPAMAREIQNLWRSSGSSCQGTACMGGHRDGLLSWGTSLEQALEILLNMLEKIERSAPRQ